MTIKVILFYLAISGVIGAVAGYYLRVLIALSKKGSAEIKIKEMLLGAKEEAKRIAENAELQSTEILKESRVETKEKEEKNIRTEERLIKKEEMLDKRQLDIDSEVGQIKDRINEIKAIKERADELLGERSKELERTASLTREQAKQELILEIEKKEEQDMLVRMQKIESSGTEKLERRAQEIILNAVQRLGTSVSADIMSTSVTIPTEEMKGKIIGKEGRNIKAFERVTGVEVIIDDTPNQITLSSFNPVRRHIAKTTLEYLIADGRIQPAKIEEMYEKAKGEINRIIKEKGEHAVYECGVFNLDPRIVLILGRLHFRTSYGQNVLQHSVEVAHMCGMIAEEVGVNVSVAKAGGLLHDIGKALDHEVQGTHVEIGRRILQKFGVSEEVVKAMQAHHGEYPYETPESIIVQVADAISGSRPGARKDSIEHYLKRLEDLEAIANTFKGVEKTYALSAGREVRVFVTPTEITDIEAKNLARDIAVRIENELKYPGEIKITIIREMRVVDFAR